MTFVTSRRTAILGGLSLLVVPYLPAGAQELDGIDESPALSWLPALPDDPELFPISIVTHADMAAYWKFRGIEPPRSLDDETAKHWMEIGQQLPVNDGVILQTLTQNWDDIVGFCFWDADQVTVANDRPDWMRYILAGDLRFLATG